MKFNGQLTRNADGSHKFELDVEPEPGELKAELAALPAEIVQKYPALAKLQALDLETAHLSGKTDVDIIGRVAFDARLDVVPPG